MITYSSKGKLMDLIRYFVYNGIMYVVQVKLWFYLWASRCATRCAGTPITPSWMGIQ